MIETKKIKLSGHPQGSKEMVKLYKESLMYPNDLIAFGWKPAQVVTERYGRSNLYYQLMTRDTEIPNYQELRKYEVVYEDARANIKEYTPAEFSTALLLLLLLVIPGVLYITFKTRKKLSIKSNNEKCRSIMEKATTLARLSK